MLSKSLASRFLPAVNRRQSNPSVNSFGVNQPLPLPGMQPGAELYGPAPQKKPTEFDFIKQYNDVLGNRSDKLAYRQAVESGEPQIERGKWAKLGAILAASAEGLNSGSGTAGYNLGMSAYNEPQRKASERYKEKIAGLGNLANMEDTDVSARLRALEQQRQDEWNTKTFGLQEEEAGRQKQLFPLDLKSKQQQVDNYRTPEQQRQDAIAQAAGTAAAEFPTKLELVKAANPTVTKPRDFKENVQRAIVGIKAEMQRQGIPDDLLTYNETTQLPEVTANSMLSWKATNQQREALRGIVGQYMQEAYAGGSAGGGGFGDSNEDAPNVDPAEVAKLPKSANGRVRIAHSSGEISEESPVNAYRLLNDPSGEFSLAGPAPITDIKVPGNKGRPAGWTGEKNIAIPRPTGNQARPDFGVGFSLGNPGPANPNATGNQIRTRPNVGPEFTGVSPRVNPRDFGINNVAPSAAPPVNQPAPIAKPVAPPIAQPQPDLPANPITLTPPPSSMISPARPTMGAVSKPAPQAQFDEKLTTLAQRVQALTGYTVKPDSHVRTAKEQEGYFAQGRTKPGKIITPADGTNVVSQHQKGQAADLAFFDKSGKKVPITKAIREALKKATAEQGLVWGGEFSSPEPWHIQLNPVKK